MSLIPHLLSSSFPEERAEFDVGSLVEVVCDNEAGTEECWLPARVAAFRTPNTYSVQLLGDDGDSSGGGHQVDATELRPVQDHGVGGRGGAEGGRPWATPTTTTEGLRVEAFYAQGGEWLPAHVDGCDCDDTAVVTFDDFDEQEEIPLRYLRAPRKLAETHAQFVARQMSQLRSEDPQAVLQQSSGSRVERGDGGARGRKLSPAPPTIVEEFNLSKAVAVGSTFERELLPSNPEEAFLAVKKEATKAVKRLMLDPKGFFNMANKTRSTSIIREEIAETYFRLTNFDIDPDDAVMDLLVRELDPLDTGDVTFPMLRKNWPKDFHDATAVIFHGNARPANSARKGKKEGEFGGWVGASGTPRGMSYAQQAVIQGRQLQTALPPNTFSYGYDDGGPTLQKPKRGMPRVGVLPTPLETLAGKRGAGGAAAMRQASRESVRSGRTQSMDSIDFGGGDKQRSHMPISQGGWGNRHRRRKAQDGWQE
jgi:hypothetical protein